MNRTISPAIDKNLDLQKINTMMKTILLCAIGFSIGRSSINGYCPMIISYYLSIYEQKKIRFWILMSIILGIVMEQSGINIIRNIFSLTIISLIGYSFNLFRKKLKFGTIILVGAVTSLLIGISYYSYLDIANQKDILYIFLESLLIIFLSLVYKPGVNYITSISKGELSKEVVISVSLIFASAIIGIFDIQMLGIPILQIVSMLILLILGYGYGLESSAIMGSLIGFATIYTDLFSYSNGFIVWSILGLVAGLFREIGKIGTIIAYNITFALIWIIYLSDSNYLLMFEIMAIVSILFLVIPISKKANKSINKNISKSDIELNIESKLNKFAETYSNIGRMFASITKEKNELSNNEINQLIDDVASRVCSNCSMCNLCWKKDFYETYRAVYSILSAVEKKGQVLIEDIPEEFYNHCLKVDEFVVMVNRIFELYKTNLKWKNKVIENRELFAEQFLNMSNVIKELSNSLSEGKTVNQELIKRLKKELEKSDLEVIKVDVVNLTKEKSEIIIELYNYGDINQKRELLKIINKIKSNQYQLKHEKEFDNNCIQYVFVEKENYRLVKGIAKANKDYQHISGDNYSFLDMENGKDIVVLSDGMGSGEKAFIESKTAIEMLEHMLEGGFDVYVAIKTVNSLLGVRNDNQSFATLDISIIDRYTAECSFIKNGAVSTFLKREDKVEIIKSNSLPLGVLKDVELKPIKKQLKADDLIIMITDGIIDTGKDTINKEEWLEQVIQKCDSINPQKVADYILQVAKDNNNGTIDDDMTVLAFRVWERIS